MWAIKYEYEWIKNCSYSMINNEDIGKKDSYIFYENRKIENSQIPLSLTTVSPCKNEWEIWMIISLYYYDQKVIFNK